jgi:Tfp pilus assembly major pilin PilA
MIYGIIIYIGVAAIVSVIAVKYYNTRFKAKVDNIVTKGDEAIKEVKDKLSDK